VIKSGAAFIWTFTIDLFCGVNIYLFLKTLTFVGPSIVIYFYSKTNQTHNISNLFNFGTKLYMFRRSLRPSSGVLLAGGLLASSHRTCMTHT